MIILSRKPEKRWYKSNLTTWLFPLFTTAAYTFSIFNFNRLRVRCLSLKKSTIGRRHPIDSLFCDMCLKTSFLSYNICHIIRRLYLSHEFWRSVSVVSSGATTDHPFWVSSRDSLPLSIPRELSDPLRSISKFTVTLYRHVESSAYLVRDESRPRNDELVRARPSVFRDGNVCRCRSISHCCLPSLPF